MILTAPKLGKVLAYLADPMSMPGLGVCFFEVPPWPN